MLLPSQVPFSPLPPQIYVKTIFCDCVDINMNIIQNELYSFTLLILKVIKYFEVPIKYYEPRSLSTYAGLFNSLLCALLILKASSLLQQFSIVVICLQGSSGKVWRHFGYHDCKDRRGRCKYPTMHREAPTLTPSKIPVVMRETNLPLLIVSFEEMRFL